MGKVVKGHYLTLGASTLSSPSLNRFYHHHHQHHHQHHHHHEHYHHHLGDHHTNSPQQCGTCQRGPKGSSHCTVRQVQGWKKGEQLNIVLIVIMLLCHHQVGPKRSYTHFIRVPIQN